MILCASFSLCLRVKPSKLGFPQTTQKDPQTLANTNFTKEGNSY